MYNYCRGTRFLHDDMNYQSSCRCSSDLGFDRYLRLWFWWFMISCLTSSNYCLSLGRHVTTEYEQKVKPATSHSYFVTSPPPSPSGNNMRFCFLVGFRFCSQTLQIFFVWNFGLCDNWLFWGFSSQAASY